MKQNVCENFTCKEDFEECRKEKSLAAGQLMDASIMIKEAAYNSTINRTIQGVDELLYAITTLLENIAEITKQT